MTIEYMIGFLFEGIPYTMQTDQAKDRIGQALQRELDKEQENSNKLQAMGTIMSRYGTLLAAGKLAGYSEEEVSAWSGQTDNMDRKAVQKLFGRVKRRIYLLSLGMAAALLYVVNALLYREFINLVFAAAAAGIVLLCAGRLAVFSRQYSYERVRLVPDGCTYVKEQSDRYGKRLVNGILISIILLFSVFFTALHGMFHMQLKPGELVQFFTQRMGVVYICLFLCLKNYFCRRWVNHFYPTGNQKKYRSYLQRLTAAAVLYWLVVTVVLFVFYDHFAYINNVFLALAVLYAVAVLVCSLTLRRETVHNNIHINKRRIAAFSMAVILVTAYQVLKMDVWLVQPYISTVSALSHGQCPIDYDEETGVYTITAEDEEFKILQLTDIHLGGSIFSTSKDLKALKAVYRLIEYTSPDFIIVTGDLVFPMGIMSYSLNNYTPIMQFASFMRNINIPWAFIYGNHDTEGMAVSGEEELAQLFCSVSYRTSQNLLYPYIQPDIMGRNNQVVEIHNQDGSVNQVLFLMDSNSYTGEGINQYDYIHDDQVEWYERQLKKITEREGQTVSSMIFFHMPLQEYKEAYELYEKGSKEVTYYFGEIGETMINKICCSDFPSRLFDTALRLGSTKAMFCGHDHYNNLSVEYKGIRLTYGMSIDYLAMPGIEKDTKQRGATLITLLPDSEFEIEQVRLSEIS